MPRVAVATLWRGSRTVCELRLDGRPSAALVSAAGVRWRGIWQSSGTSYQAADGVAHEAAVWRAVATPTGAPGVDAAWTLSGEADLFALVGRSLVAENDGVPVTVRALERTPSLSSSGVGGAGGPAGSLPDRP